MAHRSKTRIASAGMLSVALSMSALGGTALAASNASSPAGVAAQTNQPKTVVGVAKSSEDFSNLVNGLVAAELVKTLKGKGPFTVFAPTNDAFLTAGAFGKVPEVAIRALLDDPGARRVTRLTRRVLTNVLKYHVVAGEILAEDLKPTQTVKTLLGEEITITVNDDGTATITDANGNVVNITETDLKAKNGVVHAIDGVLKPSDYL